MKIVFSGNDVSYGGDEQGSAFQNLEGHFLLYANVDQKQWINKQIFKERNKVSKYPKGKNTVTEDGLHRNRCSVKCGIVVSKTISLISSLVPCLLTEAKYDAQAVGLESKDSAILVTCAISEASLACVSQHLIVVLYLKSFQISF